MIRFRGQNFHSYRHNKPPPFCVGCAGGRSMKLLDQLRAEIRLRHYLIRTEHSYCEWVVRYMWSSSTAQPLASTRPRARSAVWPVPSPPGSPWRSRRGPLCEDEEHARIHNRQRKLASCRITGIAAKDHKEHKETARREYSPRTVHLCVRNYSGRNAARQGTGGR
jgi:hypothetical protein